MEILRDSEEKILCPYNVAHHIRKARMDVHLKKCRKAYPESETFGICDFNAAHRIPQPELQYHHGICPNRKEVELHVFTEEGAGPAIIPAVPPGPPVPVDDSWDAAVVPTYDPQKYCEANPILRRIDTESASTRRNFRISERQRFNNFDLDKREDQSTGTRNVKVRSNPTQIGLPHLPVSDSATAAELTPDSVAKLLEETAIRPKRSVITVTPKKS